MSIDVRNVDALLLADDPSYQRPLYGRELLDAVEDERRERLSEDDTPEPSLTPIQQAIATINGRYFAILNGAKVQYYREDTGKILTPMDQGAFAFELADMFVECETTDKQGKPKATTMPATKIWRSHPDRRYYPGGFVLEPECDRCDVYNLWQGFAVEPEPGDWSLMWQHILHVLASGNRAHADYILRWAAWCVQYPATPPRVALIFRGVEGCGKGIFCNALVELFGPHGQRIQHMLHLVGRFNSHLRNCCFLFVDEALSPESDGFGALKGLVTEPTLPIEAKGVDVVNAPNHLHVCMASNERFILPAGPEARRWAVFDVSPARKGDKAYFDALGNQMANGGLAGMLKSLLAIDLTGWTPESTRPDTAALADQKAESLTGFDRLMLDILQTGELPPGCAKLGKPFLRTSALANATRRRQRSWETPITVHRVAQVLKALKFERGTDNTVRGFETGELRRARGEWASLRFPVEWDPEVSDWTVGAHMTHDEDEQAF